ncbi:MAG: hypothetical protein EAZ40_01635, partial [Rhodobacterales bacterium]
MKGSSDGLSERIERISRLFAATATGSVEVAQRSRFLRARRDALQANQPTRAGLRAGEILFTHRPVLLLDALPFDPTDQVLAELAAVRAELIDVANMATASVGLIEVERDGAFQPVGTCFRVAGGPARIVTSGHLMRDILAAGAQIRRGNEYLARPTVGHHRATRVQFPAGTFQLAKVLCAHPAWDLMVADLEPAAAAIPALSIETDLNAPGTTGDLVA